MAIAASPKRRRLTGAERTSARRIPLTDEPDERAPSRPHTDLPGNAVRRLALGLHPPGMDPAEMVPGAERDPVRARIPAAARAEDDVMIVQLPPRRADRDRAPPPVTREHRIAMARLPLPFRFHVHEQRFESADALVAQVARDVEATRAALSRS